MYSYKNEETMSLLAIVVTAWLAVIWAVHLFVPALAERRYFATPLDGSTLILLCIVVSVIGIPVAISKTAKLVKRIRDEKIEEPSRFKKILLFNFLFNIILCSLVFGLLGLIPFMNNAFIGLASVLVTAVFIGFVNVFAAPIVTGSNTYYTRLRRFSYLVINFVAIWLVIHFMWGSFFGVIVRIYIDIFPTAIIIAVVMAIICRKGVSSYKLYYWIFNRDIYRQSKAESMEIRHQMADYERDRRFNRTVSHLYHNTEAGDKARDLARRINN